MHADFGRGGGRDSVRDLFAHLRLGAAPDFGAMDRRAAGSPDEAAPAGHLFGLAHALCERQGLEALQFVFAAAPPARLTRGDLAALHRELADWAGLPPALEVLAVCDPADGFDHLAAARDLCAALPELVVGPSGRRDQRGRTLWCWVAEDGLDEIVSTRSFHGESAAALDAVVEWYLPLRPSRG